jgi:hypothetical protein
MSAFAIAATAFGLIFGSTLLGMRLRASLPENHLSGDSKDVIRLATALIATMAAVVLALLFASTRASYEHTSAHVSRLTANMIELDQLLEEYGPEAAPLRQVMRDEIDPLINSIWRESALTTGATAPSRLSGSSQSVIYKLRELVPRTAVQSSLQARALQIGTDMGQIRLILFAQPTDLISRPFVGALVLWLMFIFATFSMSARPNTTIVVVMFICVLSTSSAIFLIVELGQPFDGLMQISSESLRHGLPPLR